MSIRRYSRTPVFGINARFGTSFAIPAIRANMELGNIRFNEIVSREKERLDILAGKIYGDSKLWWIIAAASNIGFMIQVPAGTILRIPDLNDVSKYTG